MQSEGRISKKNIQRWLANYASLAAGDILPDSLPTNSGAKVYDGIHGGQLNKIMLDEAIGNLGALNRACVVCRWIKPISRNKTLKMLNITSDTYYKCCSDAVKEIYMRMNGEMNPYADLLESVTCNQHHLTKSLHMG